MLPLIPLMISLVAFVLIFGGIFIGSWLRRAVPGHHLNSDAKDIVRLGAGLMATIAALVLGLLITSAKSSYDTQSTQIRHMTVDLILLDRILNDYGPEAREAREVIRQAIGPAIEKIWRTYQSNELTRAPFEPLPVAEKAIAKIFALTPLTDAQSALKARAMKITVDFAQSRLAQLQLAGSSIPGPFLAILIFWLMIIFASFSLFSDLNATVIVVLLVFALSASTALFLILEMDNPFTGLMQISSAPLRNALVPLTN